MGEIETTNNNFTLSMSNRKLSQSQIDEIRWSLISKNLTQIGFYMTELNNPSFSKGENKYG